MQPTQSRPGHYWRSDDASDMWLNHATPDEPKTITCVDASGRSTDMDIKDLEFLAAGLFGEGRPTLANSFALWTGSSYRYGVYAIRKPPRVAVLETSGAGLRGIVLSTITSVETWEHLAATSSPEMLWNICHQMHVFHREALDGGRHAVFAAFAEGRLKKRRRRGKIQVYLESAP